MCHNGSNTIDHGRDAHFNCDIYGCVPDGFVSRRPAIDYQPSLNGIQDRSYWLSHRLVINLLFITFNPLGWANNPVLGRDDCKGGLATLLGSRGERAPVEGLVEDPRIDVHGRGGFIRLALLLGGRQEDQHATHPTCQWRLLPFEQMFGYPKQVQPERCSASTHSVSITPGPSQRISVPSGPNTNGCARRRSR